MPIVNFDQISSLFNDKASDRAKITPADSKDFNLLAAGSGSVRNAPLLESATQFAKEAANTTPQPAGSGLNDRQNAIFNQQRARQPYGGQAGSVLGEVRTGFVLTSDLWRQENKALVLHAGPSNAEWSLALRASDEENKAGHARYAQARSSTHGGHGEARPTFFDFPKVSFSFQSGNIMPIPGFFNDVEVAYGLQDFYNFFSLLNQPPILPPGPNEGKHNYTWIFYTSLQLPQATLKGYFDPEGISWTDSAENPSSVEWNASFTVHEMTPNLWEVSELLDAYKEFMRSTVRVF